MPDKPLTVFTYAASASLAAVALVYFFHPNYLLDSDSLASAKDRKKGIVGLSNPANDCFINCVLQSLAGLGDLRIYLIRELHRRDLGGADVYAAVPEKDSSGKPVNAQKLASLQQGVVTKGLKEIIDGLNERPIYRKTISAAPFIRVLERAFNTAISKSQQDAQELLQLVAERLSEEYHAGKAARKRYKESHRASVLSEKSDTDVAATDTPVKPLDEDEDGFPLGGKTEAKVECEFCHFVPKAIPTSFVMLNLMVPQKASCTLNDCFDAQFKTEYIDDYKCDRCRLVHAVEQLKIEQDKAGEVRAKEIDAEITALVKAIADDPEKPPKGVNLPDMKIAPKRKIARHIEITEFPRVLVIHLSRSIFDSRNASYKNTARVSFPERLPVGGFANRRHYKLLGVVTHKGTHNSGHYETFRRQHAYAPFSNPHTSTSSGPYAANDPLTSTAAPSVAPSSTANDTTTTTTSSPSTPRQSSDTPPNNPTGSSSSTAPTSHTSTTSSRLAKPQRRRRAPPDRWWRISDDKIRDCKTDDVLGMTREVYMLFFEMER